MKSSESLIRKFFEQLNTGDMENVRPMVRDASWRPMVKGLGHAEEYRGDAIVDEFLKPVRDAVFVPGDPKVSIDLLVADDDAVAVETAGTGKLRGGGDYDNRYAWFFRVKDGKIVEIREYLDSLYVAGLAG